MGLSSSQARLLTLTSRQHTIEGNAHRLQANKLRLANDSDAVYAKYIAALDDTFLKTKQISCDSAHEGWIDGSVNNLLRYRASELTSGDVFYVKDIDSGKLYMPKTIGDLYDANIGDYRAFVRANDPSIQYEHVDHNQYILDNYNYALTNGFNTILASSIELSDRIVHEYLTAEYNDSQTKALAGAVLSALAPKGSGGVFKPESNQLTLPSSLKSALNNVVLYSSSNYSAAEVKLFKGTLMLMQNLSEFAPINKNLSNDYFNEFYKYSVDKMTATLGGTEYIRVNYNFDQLEIYTAALNGGTIKWVGTEQHDKDCTEQYNTFPYTVLQEHTVNDSYEKSENIYNDRTFMVDGSSRTMSSLLSAAGGYDKVGDALKAIFTRVYQSTSTEAQTVLNHYNVTTAQIEHYKEYKKAAEAYATYQPDYEWVPSDKTAAKYWEEIYNAIESSDGWIEVESQNEKSPTWVSNMIKNNAVILTTWDYENERLTTTSSALNTSLKEVTDQAYIENVSQIYESELEAINLKDARIDKRLSMLETEREALMLEMDSIKEVIKDNVEEHFKFFS